MFTEHKEMNNNIMRSSKVKEEDSITLEVDLEAEAEEVLVEVEDRLFVTTVESQIIFLGTVPSLTSPVSIAKEQIMLLRTSLCC